MTAPADPDIIELLRDRDGQATEVRLTDGRSITVFNIAWGYDEGDGFAHITTNISPSVAGTDVDFFYTSDVMLVRDPSGAILLPQD